MKQGERVQERPVPPSEEAFHQGFSDANQDLVAEMISKAKVMRLAARHLLMAAKKLRRNARDWQIAQKDSEQKKRGSRGRAQAEIVLETLLALYGRTTLLTPPPPGRASPAKQAVRQALEQERGDIFVKGGTVFNNVWQRLMNDGVITYATRTDEG